MLPNYQPPSCYTGELFGILYLYQQSDRSINWKDEDLDQLIDEGFEEFTEEESTTTSSVDIDPTLAPPSDMESSDEEEVNVCNLKLTN